MEFIVGTHAHLIAIEVNGTWELQRLEVLNTGHHYGIGLLDKKAATRFMVRGPGRTTLSSYERHVSDTGKSCYRKVDSSVLGEMASESEWGDVHQIASCNKGLYLTNTQSNSLVFLSDEGGEHVYHFEGFTSDRNHVNSAFPSESGQIVVMLHNRGRENSEVAVLEHDQNGFRLLNRIPIWDKNCHNIFVENGLLAYNASIYGDFVLVSLETGKVIQRLHFPGHTKGLSVTKDYFIIGHSEHAVRKARKFSGGTIEVIGRNRLQRIATVELTHEQLEVPVGNVNEIRCLSEPELGHSASTCYEINWKRLRLFTDKWPQRLGPSFRQLRSRIHVIGRALFSST